MAGALAGQSVQATRLGTVESDTLRIAVDGTPVVHAATGDLRMQYEGAIPTHMAG
jgi:hypothetical protein